nr:myosin-14-like [Aegilops tauschii subsp. strangulata]
MSDNFQKLQALHRTRKEKLDSRAAVVDAVEADRQKHVEQTQSWFNEAWQELRTGREQLGQPHEEAAQQAAKEDAQLRERRVLLNTHEEDLAAHEEALAAKLRGKDEEVEKLVAEQTQGLEQEHKKALDGLVLDHAGKMKEAVDAAEAVEAAKSELAGKVDKLEEDLENHDKEISKLKSDREKTMYTLAEFQTTISDKTQQLSSANDSIADLKLKLTTLEESLEGSRGRGGRREHSSPKGEKKRAASADLEAEASKKGRTSLTDDSESDADEWCPRMKPLAGCLVHVLPQRSSSFGNSLGPNIMDSESPPPASSLTAVDNTEMSSRRTLPEQGEVPEAAKTAPKETDEQPPSKEGGAPTPPATSVNAEVPDTLVEALQSATIVEEHHTLMGTVIEKVQSMKSGQNEAYTSLLRGFEAAMQASASHAAEASELKRKLEEKQADAAEVETLKNALVEAQKEAEEERASLLKHESRVEEVQQEIKDAIGKSESLERKISEQGSELAKALQSAQEARAEAQSAVREIQEAKQIAADNSISIEAILHAEHEGKLRMGPKEESSDH